MLTLKEIMSRHFESTGPDEAVKDAVGRMDSLNLWMLPVCEDNRLVGMIESRQVRRSIASKKRDPARMRVRDVMSHAVLTGSEDQHVDEAVQMMRKRAIHTLPVLDSQHRVVGIFSLGGPWRRYRE